MVEKIFCNSLEDNISFGNIVSEKKATCYCHHQDIVENTSFILDHFQEPTFLRTIATFLIKGKQISVNR